jgi:ATP-dependent Lon protease
VPKENEKDLADIPENIKRSLEIVPVTNVEEVLEYALVNTLVPIEWKNEEDDQAAITADQNDGDGEHTGLLKH